MQVELALGELGHLCWAAGDGEARDGMLAQIFQEAADKIAHLDQRVIGQAVQRADAASEVSPVAAPMWTQPLARATSTPRWIEWIQAEHE